MVDEVSPVKEADTPSRTERASPILLALIEHGSRPAALVLVGLLGMVWLFSMRQPLLDLIGQVTTLKIGSFEVQLQLAAQSADLVRELDALRDLNSDQLQLFLVIGKRREHITYRGPELTAENVTKLRDTGLVEEWRTEPDGSFWWRISDKANKLHDIIQNMVFSRIRRRP
jgi:hypothetical protein